MYILSTSAEHLPDYIHTCIDLWCMLPIAVLFTVQHPRDQWGTSRCSRSKEDTWSYLHHQEIDLYMQQLGQAIMVSGGKILSKVTRIQSDSCKYTLQESMDSPPINVCFTFSFTRVCLDSPNFNGKNFCKNGFSDSHQNSCPGQKSKRYSRN